MARSSSSKQDDKSGRGMCSRIVAPSEGSDFSMDRNICRYALGGRVAGYQHWTSGEWGPRQLRRILKQSSDASSWPSPVPHGTCQPGCAVPANFQITFTTRPAATASRDAFPDLDSSALRTTRPRVTKESHAWLHVDLCSTDIGCDCQGRPRLRQTETSRIRRTTNTGTVGAPTTRNKSNEWRHIPSIMPTSTCVDKSSAFGSCLNFFIRLFPCSS